MIKWMMNGTESGEIFKTLLTCCVLGKYDASYSCLLCGSYQIPWWVWLNPKKRAKLFIKSCALGKYHLIISWLSICETFVSIFEHPVKFGKTKPKKKCQVAIVWYCWLKQNKSDSKDVRINLFVHNQRRISYKLNTLSLLHSIWRKAIKDQQAQARHSCCGHVVCVMAVCTTALAAIFRITGTQ